MVTFEYQGFDEAGRACKGLVEAGDLKQARAQLLRQGILAEKITPAAGGRRRRCSRDERAMIYHELSLLLHAGLPLVEALEVVLRTPDLERVRTSAAEVRDRVRGGDSLSRAVADVWRAAADEQAVIAAGERAAALSVVLERLAGFMEEQRHLRERAFTALIYPAIVAGLALLIAFGLLGVALPRFGRLMAEARIELPPLTRFMLGAGDAVMIAAPVIALALGLIVVWWRRRMAANDDFARKFDGKLLVLPFFGAGRACLATLRFVRALEMLLAGGVPLVDALALAGETTGNRWLAARIRAAADDVRHGAGLAASLERIPPLGGLLGGWISVGEAGGMLEQVLRNLGDRLQRRWEKMTTRRLMLLEPALIVVVGIIVLLVALAVLLPIVRLNQLLV